MAWRDAEDFEDRARIRYYNIDGEPITLEEWANLFEKSEYRFIEQTELPYGFRVSTIWLGLDHNWFEEGPPVIFESMVFGPENFGGDDMQTRYSTEAQARAGHAQLVKAVMAFITKTRTPKESL